jgi:hypothetical protein
LPKEEKAIATDWQGNPLYLGDPCYLTEDGYVQEEDILEYVLQMAIYQELLLQQYGKTCTPIIAAVSKQTPSEARLITIDQDKMNYELILLKEKIERIVRVKNGEEKPVSCGTCEYCRGHNKITKFTSMDDL